MVKKQNISSILKASLYYFLFISLTSFLSGITINLNFIFISLHLEYNLSSKGTSLNIHFSSIQFINEPILHIFLFLFVFFILCYLFLLLHIVYSFILLYHFLLYTCVMIYSSLFLLYICITIYCFHFQAIISNDVWKILRQASWIYNIVLVCVFLQDLYPEVELLQHKET